MNIWKESRKGNIKDEVDVKLLKPLIKRHLKENNYKLARNYKNVETSLKYVVIENTQTIIKNNTSKVEDCGWQQLV